MPVHGSPPVTARPAPSEYFNFADFDRTRLYLLGGGRAEGGDEGRDALATDISTVILSCSGLYPSGSQAQPDASKQGDTVASLELMFTADAAANRSSPPFWPFATESSLQGPLRNMRPVGRCRLDRDRPGFGKPCDFGLGPFSGLRRI